MHADCAAHAGAVLGRVTFAGKHAPKDCQGSERFAVGWHTCHEFPGAHRVSRIRHCRDKQEVPSSFPWSRSAGLVATTARGCGR